MMTFSLAKIGGLIFILLILMYLYHVSNNKTKEGMDAPAPASSLSDFIDKGMKPSGWLYIFNKYNNSKDGVINIYTNECQNFISSTINDIQYPSGNANAPTTITFGNSSYTFTGGKTPIENLKDFDDALVNWSRNELNKQSSK